MTGHIYIIGCGIQKSDIPYKYRYTIIQAHILAGGQRLLDWFPEFSGKKVPFTAYIEKETSYLIEQAGTSNLVVLASGDPLFFGIAKRFIDLCESDKLTIIPNITAVQQACVRLKIPWDQMRLFTVHGRNTVLPWRRILQASQACIYGDWQRPPEDLARILIDHYPQASKRRAYIVADLGNDQEYIAEGTLEEMSSQKSSGLSMLIITSNKSMNRIDSPHLSLGIPDTEYEHERNLITHPEIRAIILSKLHLGPGVFWDLGAGSGSVSLEACGLITNLEVYAVEKNEKRCSHIEKNKSIQGIDNIHIRQGQILEIIDHLPIPRSIFIGGGGREIATIIENAFAYLLPQGRMVIAAVLLETKTTIQTILPQHRVEILEIEMKRNHPVGKDWMLKPDNPVTLYVYEGIKP